MEPLGSVEAVVERYAGLVKRIAYHLHGRMPQHVNVEDMIQSGMIGLIDAARKYDDTKGASFETYAGIRIRGAILDEVRRGDWAPRSVYRNSRRVTEAIRSVENRLGRDAKDAEIAAELGISMEEYFDILQDLSAVRLFSISELAGPGDAYTPLDVPSSGTSGSDEQISVSGRIDTSLKKAEPHRQIEEQALVEAITHAIEGLPEREQLILSLYYNEELNLREIGEIMGVSESRVSQLHSQAIHRLRSKIADW